jgi:hypothetical protein
LRPPGDIREHWPRRRTPHTGKIAEMTEAARSSENRLPGATRKVGFVIVSRRLSAAALKDAMDSEPDASKTGTERFPSQATWELWAFGSPSDDLSSLIEDVLERARLVRAQVAALRAADPDLACVLRVIQYIHDDPLGPGFALRENDVALLAELGAFVDVDQYYVG